MSRRPQLFAKTLFLDFLMNTLGAVIAVMLLTKAEHKKKAEEDATKTDGLYAIIMEWPDANENDIDLYVRDPKGTIAFFQASDVGLMHLEHDDRGSSSDKMMSGGSKIVIMRNEERVIIRGAVPGEYIVNVHLYGQYDTAGLTPVSVRLVRLKGEDKEFAKGAAVLERKGDERTAFRFTLDAAGVVTDVNHLERSLMGGGR